jgi:hypothetical protein
MARLAAYRDENPRVVDTPSEITSRIPTRDIPEVLERLEEPYPNCEVDVALASNMISVGVDVPRLGLMVVVGQPKASAEYIQATSRVGRGDTPGLVVVLYNAQRPRDRSRYESFATWHAALYRDVEPSSVTPFASRARDRAIHAPMVAMVRHFYPGRNGGPVLDGPRVSNANEVVDRIVERVQSMQSIDPDAVGDTRLQLAALVDDWAAKSDLVRWWWSRRRQSDPALLIGAEDHASMTTQALHTDSWPTPNSMREVEPATRFRFTRALARRDDS